MICSHKDTDTNRLLAVVFYLLPTPKSLPDYYEAIKSPIDIKMMAKKLKSGAYTSLKDMEADFILMMENAKRYNSCKSIIYKDACKLKRLAVDTCKLLGKLMAQGKLNENDAAENASDDLVKRQAKKKLVDQLGDLSLNDFNKRLAEAEAQMFSTQDASKTVAPETETRNVKVDKKEHVKDEPKVAGRVIRFQLFFVLFFKFLSVSHIIWDIFAI